MNGLNKLMLKLSANYGNSDSDIGLRVDKLI